MTAFTLLLPVYAGNSAAELRESFESSVHRQVRRPDAVVVTVDGPVGDGLENELAALVESSPVPVRLVRLAENRGLATALNAGLAEVDTEFVARMDADDVSLPDRFARQFAEIESRDLDLLGTGIAEFAGSTARVVATRTPPVGDEIRQRAPWAQPFNHPTVVYRLSAVREVGGYPTDVGRIEDYVLFARLLVSGARVDNLPDPLLLYRVDAGGYERRGGWRMFLDELRLQRELRRTGLTRPRQFARNVVARGSYRLAPTWLRSRVYRAAATRAVPHPTLDSSLVSSEAATIRFSLVVPAYNVERYIVRCLRSLVAQSTPAHEILVYDDGSTDGTADLVAGFAARFPSIRLIRQENTGQGAVRNRGVREATGDYLLFVDSDDELDRRTLERCTAAIGTGRPDFVGFRFQARYPAGIRGFESAWPAAVGARRELVGDDVEELFSMRWLAPWQAAYRLPFVRDNELRNGEGYLFEDQEFTAGAIVAAERVALVDAPLYRYHFNASSSLRDKSDAARRRRIDGRRRSRAAILTALDRHGATPRARALLADHDVHDLVQEIVLDIYSPSERAEVLADVGAYLAGIAPVDREALAPRLAEWFAHEGGPSQPAVSGLIRDMARTERERVASTAAFRLARLVVRPGGEPPAADGLADARFARVFGSLPYRLLRRAHTAASPALRVLDRLTGRAR